MAVLGVLWETLDMDPPAAALELPARILRALDVAEETADPAREAMETIVSLIVQTESSAAQDDDDTGPRLFEERWKNNIMFARKVDGVWLVPTRNEVFTRALEPFGGARAAELHGKRWLRAGWITAPQKGSTTTYRRLGRASGREGKGNVRCLVLTDLAFNMVQDDDC